jgi:hypothetical protein
MDLPQETPTGAGEPAADLVANAAGWPRIAAAARRPLIVAPSIESL